MESVQNPIEVRQHCSATIGKLASALAKAQGTIKNALKDSTNPHFNRTYADLASVWDACRKPLSDNNLAVIQTFEGGDNGKLTVNTMLVHGESGEWIKGSMTLTAVKNDPQGIGACSTYGRRFSLAAIVGVAPDDDDDGNMASGRGKQQEQKKAEPKKEGSKAASVNPVPAAAKTSEPEKKAEKKPIESFEKGNGAELQRLRASLEYAIMTACGGDEAAVAGLLKEITSYKDKEGNTKSLTLEELRRIEKPDYLRRRIDQLKDRGCRTLPENCPLKWPEAGCDSACYVPNNQGDMLAQCNHETNVDGPCPYAAGLIFK